MTTMSDKGKGPIFDPGLCRCCGSMKRCRLLNTEYQCMGKKEIYSDMFMDCFGLLLSHLDGLPTSRLVCAMCVARLREAAAFRAQVLRCEAAFLQLRMCRDDRDDQLARLEASAKLEVEVKAEPVDYIGEPDDAGDNGDNGDAGDNGDTGDIGDTGEPDDIALPVELVKVEAAAAGDCDAPPARRKRPRSPAAERPPKPPVKPTLPMSKMQQLMRERDPSYMIDTNVVTVVECSYVCPFKCRHNHLLCYYCGENYSDPTLLRQHTISEHHPKKFKVIEHKKMIKMDLTRIDCRLCTAKINDMESFKQHITSVHNKKYYFGSKDLILPFRLTSNDQKCALCDEMFPYFHALNKHMNKHFSNYVCETCGLGFVDKGRFVMHQQRHEEGDFPCETCGKIFKAQYNRDLHVDRVHNKRGRVFCPKCDVKLMSYTQKLKHLVEVHGEQPLSFSCNLCEKVFGTRRTLTIHRRKDHLKDYRYECQYCGQKFFTRFALNNHMPTHTGERNFKCKVCEKTYPRLKTLKDHMRIHTNDRRYRCHVCGQAFIQNCSLKGHMKSQHSEYG